MNATAHRPPATANLRLAIHPHPAVSEPVVSEPSPRAPFTVPAPLRVWRRLVEHARARLASEGTPLHVDEAAADYLLHEEREGAEAAARRGRPYWSARWGWSGWRVRTELATVRAEVQAWRSSFGRHAAAPPAASAPPARRQPAASETAKMGDAGAFPPARRQPAASPPPAEDSHTRARDQDYKTTRLQEGGGGGARAREVAGMDVLPPAALRYRRQIAAHVAADAEGRRQMAARALRAGSLPPADLLLAIEAAEAEHGVLAVAAALTVTANEAQARFHRQRLNHFHTVLESIADHVHRTQIGTDEVAAGAGVAPASRPGGGPQPPHRNARERASQLTAADVQRTGEEALALLAQLRGGAGEPEGE